MVKGRIEFLETEKYLFYREGEQFLQRPSKPWLEILQLFKCEIWFIICYVFSIS